MAKVRVQLYGKNGYAVVDTAESSAAAAAATVSAAAAQAAAAAAAANSEAESGTVDRDVLSLTKATSASAAAEQAQVDIVQEVLDRTSAITAALVTAASAAAADATAKVNAAKAELEANIAVLNGQVADITGADVWDSGTAYPESALVQDGGDPAHLYRAIQAVPAGTPLTDTTYWEFIGNYASLGEAVAATAVIVAANTTDLEAAASSLAIIVARMPTGADQLANEARVVTAENAAASATSTVATALAIVQGRMPGGAGLLATDAQVSTLTAATTAADVARGEQITSIKASLSGGGNLLQNTGFDPGLAGWTNTINSTGLPANIASSDGDLGDGQLYVPPGMRAMLVNLVGTPAAGLVVDMTSEVMSVEDAKRYVASVHFNAFRCHVQVFVTYTNDGAYVTDIASLETAANALVNPTLADLTRINTTFSATPAAGDQCRVTLRLFTTGETNSYLWWIRPMFEEVSTEQTEPSPYAPGGNEQLPALNAAVTRVTAAEARMNNTGAGKTLEVVASDVAVIGVSINDPSTGLSAVNTAIGAINLAIDQGDDFAQATADELDALGLEIHNGTTGLAATRTEFTTLKGRVDTVGGGMEAMAGNISGVSVSLNNLQIGGRNLVKRNVGNHSAYTVDPFNAFDSHEFVAQDGDAPFYQDWGLEVPLKPNTPYSVSFTASSTNGGTLYADLFPDTLPETTVTLIAGVAKRFTWEGITSSSADMATAALRFFGASAGQGIIRLGDVTLVQGTRAAVWSPNPSDVDAAIASKTEASVTTAITARVSTVEQRGAGVNKLVNSSFATNIDGWEFGFNNTGLTFVMERNNGDIGDGYRYMPAGIKGILVTSIGNTPAINTVCDVNVTAPIPVELLKYYLASVRYNSYRCKAQVAIVYYKADGTQSATAPFSFESAPTDINSFGTNPALSLFPTIATPIDDPPSDAVTAIVLLRLISTGEASPCMWWFMPLLEQATATQTQPSPYNMGGAEAFASWNLEVNAGGKVGRIVAAVDGESRVLVIDMDEVVLTNGDGSLVISGDLTIRKAGGYMSIDSAAPFGVNGDLVGWFGPAMDPSLCSKANATMYRDTAGKMFVQEIIVGDFEFNANGVTSSSPYTLSMLNNATNGAPKAITANFVVNASVYGKSDVTPTGSATLSLWRKVGAGAFVQLGATQNPTFTGTVEDYGGGWYSRTLEASVLLSVSDTDASMSDHTYEWRVTAFSHSIAGNAGLTLKSVE